jgi:hypothetical protein
MSHLHGRFKRILCGLAVTFALTSTAATTAVVIASSTGSGTPVAAKPAANSWR